MLWHLLACDPAPEPVAPPELDPELVAELQDALDGGRLGIGAPGATLAVRRSDGALWVGASGEVEPDGRFRVGSITKILVGATVASLAHDGLLTLDDPASAWVPVAPEGDRYTLRQALGHQTGLADYAYQGAVLGDLERSWAPEELLAVAGAQPLGFEPGTAYDYSNSNYIVAGLAIEAVVGRPWQEEVRARVVGDAPGIFFPGIERVEVVPGYLDGLDVSDRMDVSVPWASGELVADCGAMASEFAALFSGELVPDPVLEEITAEGQLQDGSPTGYGLGVMLEDIGHGATVGHSGSTMGFQARVRHRIADGTTVATCVDDFVAEADEIDSAAWNILPPDMSLSAQGGRR